MNHVIPAILAADATEFHSRFSVLDSIADTIQLDVLDQTLYPNISWCDMTVLDRLETTAWIELHLMVNDPAHYLSQIVRGGPIQRVIWHIEAPVDHADLLLTCERLGIEAGLAIAPRTPLDALRPFADMLDELLILGVEPGFSGQALVPDTIQRAREIHQQWPSTILGFDGGVTLATIPSLRDAGVTRFYAASAIWRTPHPVESFEALRHA